MIKIAILSTVNIKHMTMLSLYTNLLDEKSIPYDILYIDKYHEYESTNASNVFSYDLYVKREWSFLRKLFKYLGFKKYAEQIIKKNNYNFVIVWNSFTALMFIGLLIRKYNNRYCVNIRDYSYERNFFIYRLIKLIINKARFTTISSNGFREFLPEEEYIAVHSLNENLLSGCIPKKSIRNKDEVIRISFIGYVRFFDNDKKLIDLLGNDKRFLVQFFGEGAKTLEKYAEDKGYTNIMCIGRFDPKQTPEFLNRTDIINNLYGYGKIELDTAISIKTYYAAYMKIPIMVFPNTFMEKATEGFNFVANLDSREFPDELYDWYNNINFKYLDNKCMHFIKSAKKENEIFIDNFQNALNEV